MKKTLLTLLSMILVISSLLCFAACDTSEGETGEETTSNQEAIEPVGLWADAKYLTDTVLGSGSKTVTVDVEAEGKKIRLTIHTDKATLGEAMYELSLVNDPSFFDTLIGIKADWSKDHAYWSFYDGKTLMMVGINEAPVNETADYRLVYTK